MKFTDVYLRKLKPEAKKVYIREADGFALRIMPSGAKTFLLIYTFDGKRKELNLGGYPNVSIAAAKIKYGDAKKALAKGKDPGALEREARDERKRTPFIEDFVDEFITQYAKEHNRGWKEIERALKAEIVSRWGNRKITDIKRRDLVLALDEIRKRGAPVMANRVLAYTRKMFSWAVERAVLEINPFLGMSRPTKEITRERALNEAEIKAFWNNLEDCKMSDCIKRALKLLLITGQRPGEIIAMHRDEISGDWWQIPTERSKNLQAHRVFLTPLAKRFIGEGTGYIFESPAKPRKSNEVLPVTDNIKKNLPPKPYEVRTMTHDIKANLPHTPESKVVDRLKIPHFTPHDLRRTAATQWAEMGISGDLIDRLQNHVTKQKQGVGHIYNRYSYDKEKQLALEDWERRLLSIVNDETSSAKIISIKGRHSK